MTRNEIYALFDAYQEHLTFDKSLLEKFLSREAFEAYCLLAPQDQSTIMTAHTLQTGEAEGDDTVEVADFAGWVVRQASEKMLRCMELSPPEGAVQKLRQQLEDLKIVDNVMIERGMMVGRARALFEMADANGGGSISRSEMQKMLRRFKVPLTKKEFDVIWRTRQTNIAGYCATTHAPHTPSQGRPCCRPVIAHVWHLQKAATQTFRHASHPMWWLCRCDRCD